MVSRTSDWRDELGRWLKPFSGSVGSQSTATNVPALRVGTDRSWRPQERSADGEAACALGACDQLHHFIAAGVWDATPVETELLVQADRGSSAAAMPCW